MYKKVIQRAKQVGHEMNLVPPTSTSAYFTAQLVRMNLWVDCLPEKQPDASNMLYLYFGFLSRYRCRMIAAALSSAGPLVCWYRYASTEECPSCSKCIGMETTAANCPANSFAFSAAIFSAPFVARDWPIMISKIWSEDMRDLIASIALCVSTMLCGNANEPDSSDVARPTRFVP